MSRDFRYKQRVFVLGNVFFWSVFLCASIHGEESRKDFNIHLRDFKKALSKENISLAEETLAYLQKVYGDKKEYVTRINSAASDFRAVAAVTQKKALQKGVAQVRRFVSDGQLAQADALVEDLRKRYPDAEVIGYLDRDVQSKKYEALQRVKEKLEGINRLIDQSKEQEALSQALQLQASQKYIPPSYQEEVDTIISSIQQGKKPVLSQNSLLAGSQASGGRKAYRGSDEIIQWQKQANTERIIDEKDISLSGQKALAGTEPRLQQASSGIAQNASVVEREEKKEPKKSNSWWPFRKSPKKEEVQPRPTPPDTVKVFKSLSKDAPEIKQLEQLLMEKKLQEAKAMLGRLQKTYSQDPQLQMLSERISQQEQAAQERQKALDESLQRVYIRQQEKKSEQAMVSSLVKNPRGQSVPDRSLETETAQVLNGSTRGGPKDNKQQAVLEALQRQEDRRRQSQVQGKAMPTFALAGGIAGKSLKEPGQGLDEQKKKSVETILRKKSVEIKNEELREIKLLYKKGRLEEAQQRIDPLCREYPEDAVVRKLADSIKRKVEAASRKKQEQEEWLQKRREQREKDIAASRPKIPQEPESKGGVRNLSPVALKERSAYVKKIYQEAVKSYQEGLYTDTIRLSELVIKLEKDSSVKYTTAAEKLLEKARRRKR